jgi:hypothetical protein
MHFVATGTALQPHRRVLERERTSFVGMALETARLVGGERSHLTGEKTAMRIVAVRAGHRTLHKPVSMRTLKLTPSAGMARGTLLIDRGCLPHHEALAFWLVHPVAAYASNPAPGMSALDPPYMCWLIQVAGKTGLIRLCGTELNRVTYVFGRSRLRVFARRAVAGLTRLCRSTSLLVGVYNGMRILLKCDVDILMTGLAHL